MDLGSVSHAGNGIRTVRDKAEALRLPLLMAGFAISVITFVVFYGHWDHGYMWIDEAFSLWATGSAHSVWGMQTQLLAHETNPPLHFWLLYAFRRIIAGPVVAGHALNFVLAALSTSAIVGLPWRAGRPGLGLLLGIVFLMSAGTMIFMQDIRSGFTALSLCGVAIALAGTVRLNGRASRMDLIFAAALGALAGISHVYGALFVGCLGAAMAAEGALGRNRSQVIFGLVLGATCSLTFVAWFAGLWMSTGGHLVSVEWLSKIPRFRSFELVWRSYFGPVWAWYAGGVGFLLALTAASFRRSALMLLACTAMVVGLIALASQWMSIVFFRYFLILGPALHLLLAVAIYDLVESYRKKHSAGGLAALAVCGGCVALFAPVLTSTSDAAFNLEKSPWWQGIDRVRAEAANCPPHTVRVNLSDPPDLLDGKEWGFTYILQGTGLQLKDATSVEDVSNINCSVVGWAEHIPQSGAGRVPGAPTEVEALKWMKLTNNKHIPLKVDRHVFGFVIYK